MSIDIKVPVLPESVADATIAKWYKNPGDVVKRDENLVDIETDKVVLEVVAPEDGVLETIAAKEGATVKASEVIATFKSGVDANSQPETSKVTEQDATTTEPIAGPAARRAMTENEVQAADVAGSGKDGRILKSDVEKVAVTTTTTTKSNSSVAAQTTTSVNSAREDKRVPMTRLRSKIAERLLAAQHNAAILTTFNEINMQPVMSLRTNNQESFEKKYGIKLGFMSFFVKAVVESLKKFPAVNASIDGSDIVYHNYFDIGIAVSAERGLVVPIIRDADHESMADIEKIIKDFGKRAQDGQISIEEMSGGTFTISNGGVFGSLMSTPIINPPQSAILGMHKIEQRPIVENNQIVIRSMMYVALSYDHRIIDGATSVQFLSSIKSMLEEPARMILEV